MSGSSQHNWIEYYKSEIAKKTLRMYLGAVSVGTQKLFMNQ